MGGGGGSDSSECEHPFSPLSEPVRPVTQAKRNGQTLGIIKKDNL